MNNYFALTKILLKNSLTEFNSKKTGRISKKVKGIALLVVIVLSMMPLVFGIGAMVWSAYEVFAALGQEGLILATGLFSAGMMVLFFGIFYIMNVFYFSKDVENLLPLPLKPSTIMAAKFTITLIYEYLTELLILAPVLVVYGVVSKAGIAYYLYSLIAFLTLPVIPLIYAGILNMLLMRVTNISKHKDQLRIIGGVIGMFAAVFGNIKLQSFFMKATDPEEIKALLTSGNNTILDVMSGIFPSNKFLALALSNSSEASGLINMLIYLGISALCIALFLTLGESLYFKGLIGISDTASKRKKLTTEEFEKTVVMNSALKSYIIKELKLLFRTPVYFINCVMMNFIWPLFLLIPILTDTKDSMDIMELKNLIRLGSYEGIILAIAFAAVLFASGTNGITSTAISRDGESFYINRFIPVDYLNQIMGKTIAGIILGCVALLSLLIMFIAIALPPLYIIVLIVITGFLAVLFTSFTGILIDLNFPKLHWDTEQKAVKQNMNSVVNILIATITAAIILVPTLILKLNVWIVFVALVLIFSFANAVLYGLIKSEGVKLFEKIEA